MALPVSGQFAPNRTKLFQVIECHSVKHVLRTERVNAVFRMPRIIDEIVRLMPRPFLFSKHYAMDG